MAVAGLFLAAATAGLAQAAGAAALLRDASFEELANITVTTVSKHDESYFSAAAAIRVITGEQVRRSGARMVPEALRLAPGVEVGAINSRSYAVTMRGFNGTSANKLLPLVDGRSLYSQRFAGTIWDIRDLPLEDLEQIEVIGGPGGTTWGANAVNGVINLITKSARDTQGDLWVAGGGSYERAFLYARHGRPAGPDGWARFYVKAFQRADSESVNVADNNDAWGQVRAGFRYDGAGSEDRSTMVTADVFYSDADQLVGGRPDVAHSGGGHALVRQDRALAGGGNLRLQGYVDVLRRDAGGNVSEADVLDLESLVTATPGSDYQASWGLNYRLSRLEDAVLPATGVVSDFMPKERWFTQGSLFGEMARRPAGGRTQVTAGTKAEFNDFTGWELMPSVRAAWQPRGNASLWAAWSRAARIPSRFENDQVLTVTVPGAVVRTLPSPDLEAEVLNAFEVGSRWRAATGLTVDLSLYVHRYRRLVTSQTVAKTSPPGTDTSNENLGRGTSRGIELQVTWQPLAWWQLQASASWLDMDLEVAPGSTDTALAALETLSPRHQVSLRSSWNLSRDWEVDAWFRSVATLPQPGRVIPGYETLDLRIGRQLGRGWEISLAGQNLLEPARREFRFFTVQSAVPRGFYVRLERRR